METAASSLTRALYLASAVWIPWDNNYIQEKTEEFINAITQAKYKGMDNYDYENSSWIKSVLLLGFKKFVIKYYEKIFKKRYRIWPLRELSVSIHPENFYEEAKKAYAIFATGESALYANIMLQKGVVVWGIIFYKHNQ